MDESIEWREVAGVCGALLLCLLVLPFAAVGVIVVNAWRWLSCPAGEGAWRV